MRVEPNALTSYNAVLRRLNLSSGIDIDLDDPDVIRDIINDVSLSIENEIGRPLKLKTATDEFHDGNGSPYLLLNRYPLHSMASDLTIYDDPSWVYGSSTQLILTNNDFEIFSTKASVIRRKNGNFNKGRSNIKVSSYVGGFSEYYITGNNNVFDIDEGSGEAAVTLTTGKYTGLTLATELDTKLEAVSSGTYTVTYNEDLHMITMTKSTGTFSLLWLTGTNSTKAKRLGSLIGFNATANQTGALTYTSDYPLVGVPADIEGACIEAVLWHYRRNKENWTGITSESRSGASDQAWTMEFGMLPNHIRHRLAKYRVRRFGVI